MRAIRFLLGALLCLMAYPSFAATTLLPPGMQCFTDANGAIASGSLNMFYPATTTPKPTWQDSTQTTLNTQPIQLDANGCATIYGIGSYRQQLFDGPVVSGATSGNLIFDKITTDTSAYNSVFWAGLSGGTPNVITVVDTGFNGTDGTVINFTALATNTGSTTIDPSGFGAISVVKSTTAGPVSLVGGEIIQNNQISVVYSASANTFTILNPPIQSASGAQSPRCGMSGLKITNGSSPSSVISLTAADVVTESSSGLVINRQNVSLTSINITTGTTTATVNGMDGESPGTSSWVYVWVIDNGSAAAGLVSLASGNGLTPSLPSGYIYKCYAGAMRVDSGGNLMRTLQSGSRTQWQVTTATNTANLPVIQNGSTGSTTVPTWTSTSVAAVVPPTGISIGLMLMTDGTGTLSAIVAPNNNYGAFSSAGTPNLTNPPFAQVGNTGIAATQVVNFTMGLETTGAAPVIYYAASGTHTALFSTGWKDGNVNSP